MTKVNKSRDGIIGPTPNIQSRNERISTAALQGREIPTVITDDPIPKSAPTALIKPLKRMNKLELLNECLRRQIMDVEGKTKAQLIVELEKNG